MRSIILSCLMAITVIAAPAIADERLPSPDRIVLTVTEEAWVETETARVIMQVKSLLTDAAAGDAAANPVAVLDEVALGHWRMTGSHRRQTDTGFEELLVTAEARLAKDALAGLYDRAKAASQKGRVLRVMAVDFSPSLSEREATAAKLRKAIYARAAGEAKAVMEQFPEQGFRVHQVQFQGGPGVPAPRPAVRRAMSVQEDASGAAKRAGQQVSERMVLTATVVIAAPGR